MALYSEVVTPFWQELQACSKLLAAADPLFAPTLFAIVLGNGRLGDGLSHLLARNLADATVSTLDFRRECAAVYQTDSFLEEAAVVDLKAIFQRDSTLPDLLTPFLFSKGYQALQAHRLAHWFWMHERQAFALYIQNRCSIVYGVDIHPAAIVGLGVTLGQATGIVVGDIEVAEGTNLAAGNHLLGSLVAHTMASVEPMAQDELPTQTDLEPPIQEAFLAEEAVIQDEPIVQEQAIDEEAKP